VRGFVMTGTSWGRGGHCRSEGVRSGHSACIASAGVLCSPRRDDDNLYGGQPQNGEVVAAALFPRVDSLVCAPQESYLSGEARTTFSPSLFADSRISAKGRREDAREEG